MGHMVNVFATIPRMNSNYFCSCRGLEFLRPGGSDEDLRGRYKTREVDEVAQGSDLGHGLNGTFSQDRQETWEAKRSAIGLCLSPLSFLSSGAHLPTMSSWNPLLLEVYESMNLIVIDLSLNTEH